MNALAITYPDRVGVLPIGTSHEVRDPLSPWKPFLSGKTDPADEGKSCSILLETSDWHSLGVSEAGDLVRWRYSRKRMGVPLDGPLLHASGKFSFFHREKIQLVTNYDRDPTIRRFVDSFDWFIVPLLNPDGQVFFVLDESVRYEYSRSSTDPEIRLWRKNRSPRTCVSVNTGSSLREEGRGKRAIPGLFSPPRTQCCQGVDLNRNFDWFFGQIGSSTDPCSEIFQVIFLSFLFSLIKKSREKSNEASRGGESGPLLVESRGVLEEV